jgi:hypothetical protein
MAWTKGEGSAVTGVAFDTLKLARRLREQAGFKPEHAEAASEALAEAIGGAELVTKADLQVAPRDLERRLTTKVGSMLIVAVGVILAALRFFPAAHS